MLYQADDALALYIYILLVTFLGVVLSVRGNSDLFSFLKKSLQGEDLVAFCMHNIENPHSTK